jgi:hypothetical protein
MLLEEVKAWLEVELEGRIVEALVWTGLKLDPTELLFVLGIVALFVEEFK